MTDLDLDEIEEFEIPEKEEVTLYVALCVASKYSWEIGQVKTYVNVSPVDIWSDDDDYHYKILATKKVTIKIKEKDINLREEIVDGLEKRKSKMKARHHMEIKEIDDKIDQLIALEYKPQKEEETNVVDFV